MRKDKNLIRMHNATRSLLQLLGKLGCQTLTYEATAFADWGRPEDIKIIKYGTKLKRSMDYAMKMRDYYEKEEN